ncbi:MAG TPA: glycosyltransferase, partial [Myxococcota bacterium]
PTLNRASHALSFGLMSALLGKTLNRARVKHGLAPVTATGAHVLGAGPVLSGFDPELAPVPRDWREVLAGGAWFLDDSAALPGDLAQFLDDGEPPVYVGFGSMPLADRARLTRTVVDAVALAGVRAVVSRGWGGLGDDDVSLPSERVFVAGSVPHGALFPRVRCVVHHGGAGTTQTAARAGVPQVLVPHGFDQPYWALRAHAVGLAPKALSTSFSARALADAIDASVRLHHSARAFAERMRGRDGAAAAVRALTAHAAAETARVLGSTPWTCAPSPMA